MNFQKLLITCILGIILPFFCHAQSCTNWLNTPSAPSYLTVGDLDMTGTQLTIEVTFNRTAPVNPSLGYGFLVSKHSGPGNINYAIWPNGCAITTTGSGDRLISENCPVQLNKTYHVAMVYDGITLKFYRNGFLHSQVAASGNLINNDFLTTIAQNPVVGSTTIFPFIGYTNEVRIWNVARTQAQIRTYMNLSLPNPTTQAGLVAYYTFDNLLNKQGNPAYNATLNGNASINSTNSSCTFTADSCSTPLPCNSWLNITANPGYATVGDADVAGNHLTVEANFNRTSPANSTGGYGFLVSKHTGPGNVNYALWPDGCAISAGGMTI